MPAASGRLTRFTIAATVLALSAACRDASQLVTPDSPTPLDISHASAHDMVIVGDSVAYDISVDQYSTPLLEYNGDAPSSYSCPPSLQPLVGVPNILPTLQFQYPSGNFWYLSLSNRLGAVSGTYRAGTVIYPRGIYRVVNPSISTSDDGSWAVSGDFTLYVGCAFVRRTQVINRGGIFITLDTWDGYYIPGDVSGNFYPTAGSGGGGGGGCVDEIIDNPDDYGGGESPFCPGDGNGGGGGGSDPGNTGDDGSGSDNAVCTQYLEDISYDGGRTWTEVDSWWECS